MGRDALDAGRHWAQAGLEFPMEWLPLEWLPLEWLPLEWLPLEWRAEIRDLSNLWNEKTSGTKDLEQLWNICWNIWQT